jgi:hypothetical protein
MTRNEWTEKAMLTLVGNIDVLRPEEALDRVAKWADCMEKSGHVFDESSCRDELREIDRSLRLVVDELPNAGCGS